MFSRVWQSIVPAPWSAATDKERRRLVRSHLVLHFRPTVLPASTLRYTHTWGLGGMSLVLLLMLVSTGTLMMLVYEPTPGRAYESVVRLQQEVRFGGLVRSVHHWSANLLVMIAGLHLLRVFLTGAIHGPRRFNWVIGLVLLMGVLAANFTGYLLPFDQLSYWAITVCTGMLGYLPGVGTSLQTVVRGGEGIGPSTLTVFYALHTTVLPALFLLVAPLHFWRVRKAGGVVAPGSHNGKEERRPAKALFVPHLLVREIAVGLTLVAAVLIGATFFDAPLGQAANPGLSPDPAKAPWYFLGLQELLLHVPPMVAVFLIPVMVTGGLLILPYLDYGQEQSGSWFLSHRGKKMAAGAATVALILTPAWILVDENRLRSAGADESFWSGLLGLGVLVAAALACQRMLGNRLQATRQERLLCLFTFGVVALAVLTVAGLWFRGSGMALQWPRVL